MNRRGFFQVVAAFATAAVIPFKEVTTGYFRPTGNLTWHFIREGFDPVLPNSILDVIVENCARDLEDHIILGLTHE